MNLAYIISAYKYPIQLIRLVRKLHTTGTTFFIHIDKKTNFQIYDQVYQELSLLDGVYFLERHNCYWGDFGHVNATIKGIQAIYKKDISFDYAILLTGQCYPIKSNEQIIDFFEVNKGKSFMEYFLLLPPWDKRINRWHFRTFSKMFKFPNDFLSFPIKRPQKKDFEPFFWGSSYWCLERRCIDYIFNFINNDTKTNKSKFVRFFKAADIPDESFFQTILINSPLKETIINDSLRYLKWSPGSPNPQIIESELFYEMKDSKKLFARKFDLNRDSNVLDMLDTLK